MTVGPDVRNNLPMDQPPKVEGRDGLTLVISPLIALMKDQVDALHANGVAAACLNSSMSGSELVRVVVAVDPSFLSCLSGSEHVCGSLGLVFFIPELPVRQ